MFSLGARQSKSLLAKCSTLGLHPGTSSMQACNALAFADQPCFATSHALPDAKKEVSRLRRHRRACWHRAGLG